MQFPERFQSLPDYAFPRLRKLLDPHAPGAEPIAMTIGEPRHPMPDFVASVLAETIAGFGVYPRMTGHLNCWRQSLAGCGGAMGSIWPRIG
jgi:N-succinyldiaminopimelate aminotransferase